MQYISPKVRCSLFTPNKGRGRHCGRVDISPRGKVDKLWESKERLNGRELNSGWGTEFQRKKGEMHNQLAREQNRVSCAFPYLTVLLDRQRTSIFVLERRCSCFVLAQGNARTSQGLVGGSLCRSLEATVAVMFGAHLRPIIYGAPTVFLFPYKLLHAVDAKYETSYGRSSPFQALAH